MNQNSIPLEKSLSSSKSRRIAWMVLLLLVVATVAAVLVPVWLLFPFRPQTPREVEVAFILRRWSPLFSLAAMLTVLALVLYLWRGARRWWRKSALIVVLFATCAAGWFSRQNHFEWIFNPLVKSTYASANAADFVKENDRIMAVEIGGESVAYPIRLMAYHHVVQDRVGGTPIVATY